MESRRDDVAHPQRSGLGELLTLHDGEGAVAERRVLTAQGERGRPCGALVCGELLARSEFVIAERVGVDVALPVPPVDVGLEFGAGLP